MIKFEQPIELIEKIKNKLLKESKFFNLVKRF